MMRSLARFGFSVLSGRHRTGALTTVWSANHDAGNLSEWYYPSSSVDGLEGGGEFNDSGGTSVASTDQARSGTRSARLRLDGTTEGSDVGVRLFRWREARQYREAYYEAWYYIPTALTQTQSGEPPWPYCILMQMKSRNQDNSRNDPFWLLQLKPPPHSGMRLQLYWWGNMDPAAGPHSLESGGRGYDTSTDFPTGQWVRLRWWLKQNTAGNFDGALKIWQDDTLLFDLGGTGDGLGGIRTGYDNNTWGAWGTTNDWACTLYSNGLSPLPASIYVDDARILIDPRAS